MAVMGSVDDLKGLQSLPRLFIQTAAGIAVSIILIKPDSMGLAFSSTLLNVFISIFWIVGICNSINFFDNLDGGAAGNVAVATIGIAFIAYDLPHSLVTYL